MNVTVLTLVASQPGSQGSLLAPVAWLLGGWVVLLLTLILGTVLVSTQRSRLRPSSSLAVAVLAAATTTGYVYAIFRQELPETVLVSLALSLSFALGVAVARRDRNWSLAVATAILTDFALTAVLFANSYQGMVLVSVVGGTVPFGVGFLASED